MIYTVSSDTAGQRLDAYAAAVCNISRSAAARLAESGLITVNGRTVPKKYIVSEGEEIEITMPEPCEADAVPEDIPLDIVYEDCDIIVINKPSGMVVHPAPGNYSGTLVNALLYHCKDSLAGIGGVMRPGIVHRIDKDTSGLLVVAKSDEAHIALAEQLKGHGIVREYRALVRGGFKEKSGVVNLPIGRHPADRKKMAVIQNGSSREAITHYEVISEYQGISYLKLLLETGRTHQIRVHMSHKGHPLLGDTIYGGGTTRFEKEHSRLFDGQALHAKKLSFLHPKSKELLTFECELPENFKKMLDLLEKENT